jgi:hypothetical protein
MDRAEQRVQELERSAAALRSALAQTADITRELQGVQHTLSQARVDLDANREERHALDRDLARRRAASVVRQRREVVELFEATEQRLLAARPPPAERLEVVTRDLAEARRILREAEERQRELD